MTICLFAAALLFRKLFNDTACGIFISVLGTFLFAFELHVIGYYGKLVKKQTHKLLLTEFTQVPFFLMILLQSNMPTYCLSLSSENILRDHISTPDYVIQITLALLTFIFFLSYKGAMQKMNVRAISDYPQAYVANA